MSVFVTSLTGLLIFMKKIKPFLKNSKIENNRFVNVKKLRTLNTFLHEDSGALSLVLKMSCCTNMSHSKSLVNKQHSFDLNVFSVVFHAQLLQIRSVFSRSTEIQNEVQVSPKY